MPYGHVYLFYQWVNICLPKCLNFLIYPFNGSAFIIWVTIVLFPIITSQWIILIKYLKGSSFWTLTIPSSLIFNLELGVDTYFGNWVPLWIVFAFTTGCSELDPFTFLPSDRMPLDGAIFGIVVSYLERIG